MSTSSSQAPSARNPFAEAVLAHVTISPGAFVVDLACGLGRPSLEIAKRHPEVSVLGVDIAPKIVERAQELALTDGLANARFQVMDIEELALPDASTNAVVSLFGLLQVGDPERSIREMARILKPGGEFSVAAYDDVQHHTLLSIAAPVLSRFASGEITPIYHAAEPGAHAQALWAAGFGKLDTEIFHGAISFACFDSVWQMSSSPQMFGRVIDALDADATAAAKLQLHAAITQFEDSARGSYTFPISCRLRWGRR
jgi:ubiquinone/menaquinone biosynthesis C-methylase UbiE